MSARAPQPPRIGAGERLFGWFLTGPLGRVAAFFGDLGAFWLQWVRRRLRELRGR